MEPMNELTPEQRRQAIDLLERLPWGDVEAQIRDFEDALGLALEATSEEFLLWEEQAEELGLGDEFALSPDEVSNLSPEWKLAYVGRLLRTLALRYGVSVQEFGGRPSMLIEDSDSVAGLVRGVNDLIMLPVE